MLPIFHHMLQRRQRMEVNNALRRRRRVIRETLDLDIISEERFLELFRLNKRMFSELEHLLVPHPIGPRYQNGVTVTQKLLTALRFYATGSYQRSIGQDFNLGVSQTSVHRYIKEVTEAIGEHLADIYIKFPTTRQDISNKKEDFMNKFNFPGLIGAVDGTHVAILKPKEEEHNFINRKGFHSINLQIICDSNLRILAVNANYPGSSHDAFVWRNSAIRQHLQQKYTGGDTGTWLIGDSGYPLEPFLMTPFLNPPENSPEARYYNEHHIRARNCIERCIGLLKMRFRCLLKERVARYSPAFIGKLVNTCIVLHNLCIMNNLPMDEVFVGVGHDVDQPPMMNPNLFGQGQQMRQNIVNRYYT